MRHVAEEVAHHAVVDAQRLQKIHAIRAIREPSNVITYQNYENIYFS